MKVERGYELSQFVDLINVENSFQTYGFEYLFEFDQVAKWNEFCKQEPTKGMFIPCDEDGNEVDIPDIGLYGNSNEELKKYQKYFKAFQEAEKRVIFKNVEITEYPEYKRISAQGYRVMLILPDGKEEVYYDSLKELFKNSNSELETNIEI